MEALPDAFWLTMEQRKGGYAGSVRDERHYVLVPEAYGAAYVCICKL